MARQKYKSSRQNIKTVTARPAETKIPPAPAPVKQHVDENRLIVFDLKTKVFLCSVLALYILISLSGIHTSSIGNWDVMSGKPESDAVAAGTPRYIRMDEWMIGTPAIIGHYHAGMPLSNPADGAGNTPVVYGFPIKDASTILRPAQWSYFIFDVEKAFAFSWNFGIFFFLMSTFLLFMLLTKNNFWVSVAGAFFILLSSAVQWWSYLIAFQMTYLNGILISFLYLLYSRKLPVLALAGVVLLFSISGIFFNLYPPFQIPLIYLYLLLLTGFLVQRKNFRAIKENMVVKGAVVLGVLVLFGFSAYHYYTISKETYGLVLNTVYPGRRFSTGGDLINGKLFSEFFGIYLSDTNLPPQWINICEASNFIMFFPVVFYVLLLRYIKFKKFNPLLVCLSVFVLIGLIYVLAGFPAFLSRASLLSMSPASRALPILGVGNAVLLFCFLGTREADQQEKFTWIEFGIFAVAVFVLIRTICIRIAETTDNFFTPEQVTTVTLLMTASYVLIRYKSFRFVTPLACLFLLGLNISNATVHPVTNGLSPLLEHPLVQKSKAIHDKDPQARWAVFGSQQLEGSNWANLLKTGGINVFNGVKWIPSMKDMAVLDSGADTVYNRYAHIDMHTFVNGRDTVAMQLLGNDGYAIHMDPCSPRFQKLGIKYVVFTYKPQPVEVRCMTLLDSSQFLIYKRNDL